MPAWPLRRALVTGPSMAPALRHGDQVLVLLGGAAPKTRPGRIVVVRLPDGTLSVKRLTRVQDDGRVWIEGDNPFGSTDSRILGPLPHDAVRGRVLLRLWPRPGYIRP
jgi:nickel-type superoxide dismutase maturation protease